MLSDRFEKRIREKVVETERGKQQYHGGKWEDEALHVGDKQLFFTKQHKTFVQRSLRKFFFKDICNTFVMFPPNSTFPLKRTSL